MKKLRTWVKVVLVILIIIILGVLIRILNNWNDKQVDSCVSGGHSYNWCMKELNK